ncbi:MAG: hypothetical protein ACK4V1_11750 [Burkholderiaceae bacterium]
MLRRWNSRVRAYVGADVVRAEWCRGWRKPVRAQSVGLPGDGSPNLDAAIERLDAAFARLTERGARIGGSTCEIVLADAWLLYDVIEADLRDAPARMADETIRAALGDIAGVAPAALDVRWQPQGARYAACALPSSAVGSLLQVCAKHRLRLRSATGELVAVFNAQRARIDGAAGWLLAVVRPAGVQLALWHEGALAAASFEPPANDAAALERCGRALLRRAGIDGESIRCYAAGAVGFALPAGWTPLGRG